MLPRTLLPIGGMTKDEVRDHARRLGLSLHDKPESQDICFVPDRDYARVVRERRPEAFRPGAIVDREGREVGRHDGLPNFTIGQRRGLRVAMGLPIYVTRIDVAANTVTVGYKDDLARDVLEASRMQWLVDPPAEPIRAEVKIRYAHIAAAATVEPLGGGRVRVHFDAPQTAITPGQAAVFYQGDAVLGGGWIDD
jgi:tRNA-specific 2-thiouridylase